MLRVVGGKEFLNRYVDYYYVHNGDITIDPDSSKNTIIKKLNELVISWREGRTEPFTRIATTDVAKIIQVIDTDGAYISESSIIQSDDVGEPQYYDQSIHCYKPGTVINRNRKKRSVINRLLVTRQIDNIPYEICFASCNMDHLLFDHRNLSKAEKSNHARDFRMNCRCKEDLLDSIYLESVRASGTISDSWDMIQKDYNSLARHTNLNLLLEELFRK